MKGEENWKMYEEWLFPIPIKIISCNMDWYVSVEIQGFFALLETPYKISRIPAL